MNNTELAAWLLEHGGEVARQDNEKSQPAEKDQYGYPLPGSSAQTYVDSTTITAKDGAKIEIRRHTPDEDTSGPRLPEQTQVYQVVGTTPPRQDSSTTRTPEQVRSDSATASLNEEKWNTEVRDNNERSWNQNNAAEGGSGKPETHAERAIREQKEATEKRAAEDQTRQVAADTRNAKASEASAQLARDKFDYDKGEDTKNRGVQATQLEETTRANKARENAPQFLSEAGTSNMYITRYDPATGQMQQIANPNYDAVKVEADRKKAEIELAISSRRIDLDEGVAQYNQWFDKNVKTPMLLAQEARDKAAEQRSALEAEERRRQFASDFQLRKATLGQSAADTAIRAEESLLPYRAGPNEAAHMSDAINGLAAGGKINGPDASAGVHFEGADFQFDAPNFKKIAKDAVKQAVGGLTDYRPSDQEFSTADYSGVPSVNMSGAPSMPAPQYGMYQYQEPALDVPINSG